MNKLPVAETVAESYRFTFGGLGKVIGLIWLPIVVLTVGGYFTMVPYLSGMAGVFDSGDVGQQGPLLARVFVFELVSIVLLAMIGVAIAREILNPLKRPSFLRFGLGPAEFRVVGGFIGLYVLLIVFAMIVVLASMIVGFAAGAVLPHGDPVVRQEVLGVAAIAVLAGILALIYVFTRLGFLLVPASVSEGGFGLERSWQLSKGNFWRIFAVGVATLLPVMIAWLAVELAVLGTDVMNPHFELLKDPVAQARHSAEQMRVMAAHLPLLMGLGFLFAPLTYGLTFAPTAFAYRALTAKPVPQLPQG